MRAVRASACHFEPTGAARRAAGRRALTSAWTKALPPPKLRLPPGRRRSNIGLAERQQQLLPMTGQPRTGEPAGGAQATRSAGLAAGERVAASPRAAARARVIGRTGAQAGRNRTAPGLCRGRQADLVPATVLRSAMRRGGEQFGFRRGLFPMPEGRSLAIGNGRAGFGRISIDSRQPSLRNVSRNPHIRAATDRRLPPIRDRAAGACGHDRPASQSRRHLSGTFMTGCCAPEAPCRRRDSRPSVQGSQHASRRASAAGSGGFRCKVVGRAEGGHRA